MSLENILKNIKFNCFLNQGRPFDLNIGPFTYQKKYRGTKFLFFCSWSYDSTTGDDEYNKQKQILRKLPSGISYTENTTITQELPNEPKQYHTVYEWYSSTFVIHVSESYSKKIFASNNGDRIIILSDTTTNTLKSALDFKNKIKTSFSDIIEPLFKEMERYPTFNNNGFNDYYHPFKFEYVNMKSLQYDYQRLGLALTLTEYGLSRLTENEMYFIDDNPKTKETCITKRTFKSPPPILRDWN